MNTRVNTAFEIKHFVKYTRLSGGTLEILAADKDSYTVQYQDDAWNISQKAMQEVQLINQSLRVVNRIVQ
tara:strand:- start:577 stop:786 length:210 start_codon:yes stop_codon:yes gene_type:complete